MIRICFLACFILSVVTWNHVLKKSDDLSLSFCLFLQFKNVLWVFTYICWNNSEIIWLQSQNWQRQLAHKYSGQSKYIDRIVRILSFQVTLWEFQAKWKSLECSPIKIDFEKQTIANTIFSKKIYTPQSKLTLLCTRASLL